MGRVRLPHATCGGFECRRVHVSRNFWHYPNVGFFVVPAAAAAPSIVVAVTLALCLAAGVCDGANAACDGGGAGCAGAAGGGGNGDTVGGDNNAGGGLPEPGGVKARVMKLMLPSEVRLTDI